MIEYLHIRNFALIEDIKINFTKGFNVLTGETGAGKSIIIGAIGAILGEKVDESSIRTGEDHAIVEATFDIRTNTEAINILKESGIEFDISESVILRREILRNGKNKNYINATPVPLVKLKELGNTLVDIHGQHEHQTLLKVNMHIEFLDKFGKLEKDREEFEDKFKEYENLKSRIEKLSMDEREKNRLMDLLQFSINEIESANLQKGEDIELEKEYLILSNQEKIFANLEKSYDALYEREGAVYSVIEETITSLNEIEQYDNEIVKFKQELEEIFYQLEDTIAKIRDYKLKFDFSPQRLDDIIARLEAINDLKKKYGNTIEEILKYKEKSLNDLTNIKYSEEEIEKSKAELKRIQAVLSKLAVALSGRRRVVAKLLEEKVEKELNELDMVKTKFNVAITYTEDTEGIAEVDGKKYKISSKGMDNVEFLIAPNVGEELKPLKKIASGGEMARIMLALKSILGEVDRVETMIFDEIDVGIGGKTSDKVGKKLKNLADNQQVISITHQVQIARYADTHFVVTKEIKEKRTVTGIREVKDDERIKEIARMMAGENITDTTIEHAKEMLMS